MRSLPTLNVSTIIKFLLFNAEAVRQIAGSKRATWVGLLLVISAGIAREYDGEYLVAEPWYLLIPVAASLVACFCMVLLVYALAWTRNVRDVPFLETFRGFLNLYWMTAPLAWLYAIPFERFLDSAQATNANLILLGIVASWRVALMVRSVQVVYRAHAVAAFFPVILFSDVLAMAAMWLIPGPIFMIMGGVRLTESENVILGVRIWMILIGYGTFLIWLIGYLVLCYRKAPWHYYKLESYYGDARRPVSRGLWGLVAISLLVWIPVLPFTQQEQWLRWKSEGMIRAEDFVGFIKLAREYAETEFPSHWDPPPRLGYGETEPEVYLVVAGLLAHDAPQWIVNRYADKLELNAGEWPWMRDSLSRHTDSELSNYVQTISQLPNSQRIAANYEMTVRGILDVEPADLSAARRTALERLLELSKPE